MQEKVYTMMIHRQTYYKRLFAVSLLCIVFTGMLTACNTENIPAKQVKATATADRSSIPTLLITAFNYGYSMPGTITASSGLLDLAMVNNGTEPHQAQVARLNPGVTHDQVIDTLVQQKKLSAAYSLLSFVGGPDTVPAGYGQETILDLAPGQYVLLCFVTGSDGVAHVEKGMIHFFEVAGPRPAAQQAPGADVEVVMQDFRYAFPASPLPSRALIWHITNQGTEPHEMNIVKLGKGKSVQDIAHFFQTPAGPPPFEEMGGLAACEPGASAWIKLYLEPGNYAAFSFLPDQKTGQSQLALGMITPFTVK